MNSISPSRILIIAVPGVGDALLATPLIRSLKNAYPAATIDIAVREGRGSLVDGISEISESIPIKRRPKHIDSFRFLLKIWRKYDLVASTSTSDRMFWITFCAAPKRVSIVPPLSLCSFWKHLGTTARVIQDLDKNIVTQALELADLLGIERCQQVLLPHGSSTEASLDQKLPFTRKASRYVVVHMIPRFEYKCWPEQHWRKLVSHLIDLGLKVVLTSGPAPEDITKVGSFAETFNESVVNMAGQLPFDEVAELIRSAECYFGADTATTHLAAATGTPTVALFGPTIVNKWAPWPYKYSGEDPPFVKGLPVQENGNVLLISAACKCIPIEKKCLHRNDAQSDCLVNLSPDSVIPAVDNFLKQFNAPNQEALS